jgi:hypothetical protein
MWQGQCRRSGKPDEAESITGKGFETISLAPRQEPKTAKTG